MATGFCTDSARSILLDRGYNTNPTRTVASVFKVGIGTTAPTTADTDLVEAIPIVGSELIDDCETADWTDSADMTTSTNAVTYKEGTKSLNLTKDAGTSVDANTFKTTTSLDFTSKQFSIWIYVIDATALAKLATTDCLTIRFGSDSSNYYQWTKDNSDLIAGQWNLIQGLTSVNADSTTGTPTLATMDYTFIQLTATGAAITWSAGDFIMDDIKLLSADDFVKTFESGYPTFNYTTNEVTMRCRLNTLNANGYPITEFGIFNVDSPRLMDSRDIFTAISKTSTDEIIFVTKNRIE